MFDTLLPYLLAGVSVGGQYALIAVGYTLVYGILRLINFAHGDIFTAAGFFMVYLVASVPLPLAIPLVIILTVVLGFVVERVAYKPLRSAPRMSIMISAIGVSYLLQNLMWYLTGGLAKQYPGLPGLSGTVQIGPATTKIVTIATPFLTIAIILPIALLVLAPAGSIIGEALCNLLITLGNKGGIVTVRHGGHRLHAVFHELHGGHAHHRRHAGAEGLCRRGVRRHRVHPRGDDRRADHRHQREPDQGGGLDGVLGCLHLRPADRGAAVPAHGAVRRKDDGQGVRRGKR